MIRPPACARMCGRTALVIRITPKKLMSNTRWSCAMELSSAAPPAPTPALLTSTSIRPNRSITCSTEGRDRLVAGHVEVEERDPVGRGDTRRVPAGPDHLETGLDERERGRLPDARGRAGHESHWPVLSVIAGSYRSLAP